MPSSDDQVSDSLEFIQDVATALLLLDALLVAATRGGLRRFPRFRRFVRSRQARVTRAATTRARFFVNQTDVRVTPLLPGRIGRFLMARVYQNLRASGIHQNLAARVPEDTGALRNSTFIHREAGAVRFGYQDEAARYVVYNRPIRGQRRVRGSLSQFTRSAPFRGAIAKSRAETRQAILRGKF